MDITGLIALVVMAALTMGTTNLFRSGKRRRGAVMIIAAALTGGVMGVINDDGTTRAAVIEARQQQEVADRAEREAAEQAAAEAQEAKASRTIAMAEAVFTVMRRHYNMEPVAISGADQPCREDGYCDFLLGSFRVQIYGAGLATVEATAQAQHSTYREACSAVFSAISGADLDFSADLVEQAFRTASQQGSAKADVQGVQISIQPSTDNIYRCQFFKY
ncbi:hypothetical protein [Tritonibacter mobilis]|uniref:hypothetical protein n=1 Tax=Tritonibacter mobilis TaxID=379347 RepID=UPI003A5C1EB4